MSLVLKTKSVESDKLLASEATLYKYLKCKKENTELNTLQQSFMFNKLYAHRYISSKSGIDIEKIKRDERTSFNDFISDIQSICLENITSPKDMAAAIKELAKIFRLHNEKATDEDIYLVEAAIDCYDAYLINMFTRLVKTIMPHELYIYIDSFQNDIDEVMDLLISGEDKRFAPYEKHILYGLFETISNIIRGLNDNNVETVIYHSEADDVVIKITLPVYTEIVFYTTFSVQGLYGEKVTDMGPGLHIIRAGTPKYKNYKQLLDVQTNGLPATQFLLYANNPYRENRTVDVFIDRKTGNIILFA